MGRESARPHDNESFHLWGEDVQLNLLKEKFPSESELEGLLSAMDPNCQHKWFESKQGHKLHYWSLGVENPKAVVVFQHGLLSHASDAYITSSGRKLNSALLQEFCQKRGYALYAMDLIGHGFSEGTRGYVPFYQDCRDDLIDFCTKVVEPECNKNASSLPVPLFLLGYSFGGNLSLHVAKYWQDHPEEAPKGFAGVSLLAPAVMGVPPPPPVLCCLRNVLVPCLPHWVPIFLENYGEPSRVWRDEEARKLHMYPKKYEWGIDNTGKRFSLATAEHVLTAIEDSTQMVASFSVPFCAVHGIADKSNPVESTRLLERESKTPKEDRRVLYISEALHDILADPDANEQALEFIGAFVEERIGKLYSKSGA